MQFINNIKSETIIICNNYAKSKILEYINKQDRLIPVKLMTLEEFLNHLFYSYSKETSYYLKNHYNLKTNISKIYLENMKYVINSNLNNRKINILKDIYNDLKNNDLIKIDYYFLEYIKNKKIIVLNQYLDTFIKNILSKYQVEYIYTYEFKKKNSIYSFKTIDMECEFVFNQISKYLNNNINIDDIKICILGDEYKSIIKRLSYFYNIPIANIDSISILSSVFTNDFLNNIDIYSKEELFNKIKEEENPYKDIYLNIINDYYFVDDLKEVKEEIIDDLKHTYLGNDFKSIEVVNLEDLIWYKDKYVFILGFNLENIPVTYKDTDYFNDNLKKQLGIFTSFEKNKISHDKTINIINNLENVFISYKLKDAYVNFNKSNLINELNMKEEEIYVENNYSNLYNKIKLTSDLDTLLKYGVKSNNLNILYNTYFNIPYLTYSNKYTKINENILKINLSHTSLNNYYGCSFRYYIDFILKLNIFEESFSMHLGTIFHYVLSKIYEKDFDFDKSWNESLEKYSFSSKEKFYLKELEVELKNIIEIILYQYKLTGFTDLKLEKQITLNFDNDTFTGVIDKIMFKEKDNNTYISIIDYKTGTPKVNMNNLKYGLDMQLPIYIYLVKNSNIFTSPQIIGFYFEQILFEKGTKDLTKDEFNSRLDKLKLIGYTVDDPYLISIFDPTYENSEMIKGMKVSKNGFYHYTKVLSKKRIDNIINIVDSKIKEGFESIKKNKFDINPKVINGENLGCRYCKYQDLCFKTGGDLVYLKEESLEDSL